MWYRSCIRPFLFALDSEVAHEVALLAGRFASYSPIAKGIRALTIWRDPRLEVKLAGIQFPNPIGLAAGMDKRGEVIPFFDALQFGAIEIGSVTHLPQQGNPKPRIFRYIKDEALINRMGFPSEGAARMAQHLRSLQSYPLTAKIGINIGKTKVVPLEKATEDYVASFELLKEYGDYFVVNVSSPNTPELRKLQEPARLREIFSALSERNSRRVPLFVKVAPDLTRRELEEIVEVATLEHISGIIATNTTIGRDGLLAKTEESGGLSGKPLAQKSLEVLTTLREITEGALPLIAVGGIFTVEDVITRLRAGASMVQIYTSFIYEGPFLVARLLEGLSKEIDRLAVRSLAELVECLNRKRN